MAGDRGRTAKTNPGGSCQNCGAILIDEYCHVCGQAAKEPRRAVTGLVQDVFVDTLAIDGKLARTIGLLLWKPGALARCYLDGKRVSYSPPFRLYLFASVFFFFGLFWATDAGVGVFTSNLSIDEAALADLSDEERAEVQKDLRKAREEAAQISPQAAKVLEEAEKSVAEGGETSGQEGTLPDGAGSEDGTQPDDNASLKDMDWIDVDYEGPDWLEPYAKRIFEAAQRVRDDPRLFVAEIRQNVPRVLLLAPFVYGLVLLLLYIYRRRFFVYDHFVVSLYMHAALYAYLLIALILSLIPVVRNFWFAPLLWGWLQPFLVFRQAYGSNWFSAWFKWLISFVICLAAFLLILTLGLTYSLYKS